MNIYSTDFLCVVEILFHKITCLVNWMKNIRFTKMWHALGVTEGIKEGQELCRSTEGPRDWMEMMEWQCPRSQGSALCHSCLLQQCAARLETCWKTEKISPGVISKNCFYEVLCWEGTLFVGAVLGRQQWFCSGFFFPFPEQRDVLGQQSCSASVSPTKLCREGAWGAPVAPQVLSWMDLLAQLLVPEWALVTGGCLWEVCFGALQGVLGSWGALGPSALCF